MSGPELLRMLGPEGEAVIVAGGSVAGRRDRSGGKLEGVARRGAPKSRHRRTKKTCPQIEQFNPRVYDAGLA